MKLLHGRSQQAGGRGVQPAELADLGRAHLGVAGQAVAGEALLLAGAGGDDTGPDGGRGFTATVVA